jgi:transposase
MQVNEKFIGVDVSKETLDIAIAATRDHLRIANNAAGFKQSRAWLKQLRLHLQDCWFVLEYTGGYEYRLVQFLQSKGVRFSCVPGLEIKKSSGMQRGKSDRIDAQRIALYGYEKRDRLHLHKVCSASVTNLRQLLTQRGSFVKFRKSQDHRLKELAAMMDLKSGDELVKHYQQSITFAEKMIAKTENCIKELVANDAALERNFKLITSIPGIGNINGWMTIAYTDNFERFSDARKYGAYCGVVPYEHQSGKSIKGKSRISHMANKSIKAELSMAAKASVQHDPEMRAYYNRRIALGKHHMSVMNEVRFKLILRMFAVVNKQQVYVKNMGVAA